VIYTYLPTLMIPVMTGDKLASAANRSINKPQRPTPIHWPLECEVGGVEEGRK